MGEAAFLAAFLILLAASLVDWLAERLIQKPQTVSCATVILAGEGRENLEQVLRWAYYRLNKDADGCGGVYVLISERASEEEIRLAETFCRSHAGVEVTTLENLRRFLGDTVYKTVRFVLY